MSEQAAGRSVLVTGAARGIGRAIATRFAAAGDRVAILDKAPGDIAEELLDELDGSGHVFVQADVTDSEILRRWWTRPSGN